MSFVDNFGIFWYNIKKEIKMETIEFARFFADYLNKNGAIKTEIIETKGSNLFDYLIVCSSENKMHAQELLVGLLDYAKREFNQINSGLEGYKKADWIIVDFGKLAVHIFTEKSRKKYNMEKLWN